MCACRSISLYHVAANSPPKITIIQSPEVPARPDSRMLAGKTIAAAVFGALLGLIVGFVRERVREVAALTAAERAPATAV